MKLGVSYNLFDSEELLEGSIKQIRSHVDYINVIFQKISNCGNGCSPQALKVLKDLKQKKLIDDIFLYGPRFDIYFNQNEVIKRNIGLTKCREQNCSHFMTMDADEFYVSEQFYKAKEIIYNEDYDSSYCLMKTYFKHPTYEIRPFNNYYVPFIYKIKPNSQFHYADNSPVLVDPSRRLSPITNSKIFERKELEMYHMSYVRNNILTKITNSSARNSFTHIDKFLQLFENYKVGEPLFTDSPPCKETTILVDNIFNINI